MIFKKIILLVIILFICFVPYKEPSAPANNTNTDYIKWFDFSVPSEALKYCAKLDIESVNSAKKISWIDLLAILACKHGPDFKNYKNSLADEAANQLKNGVSAFEASGKSKYFSYYYEGYSCVLSGLIGYYKININGESEVKYGVKAFHPIAKGYSFSHYRDFGAQRSYGFKRTHLGNDILASQGVPIAAVESGIVEAVGWNTYGGWRLGIRSFDSGRYYYYAHLRKNKPYTKDFKPGDIVTAGDIIGYVGMTGYSTKENTENINIPHLHFGIQLIFNESQKDANSQIWIDVYDIIEFLKPYRVDVKKNPSGDIERMYEIFDPAVYD